MMAAALATGWLTESIGSAAAICTTIAFLPQLIRVWQRKSADDISLIMFLLFSTGVGLWLVYGLRIGSRPITAANAITLALAVAILILKVRYGRRKRALTARSAARHTVSSGQESGTIEI